MHALLKLSGASPRTRTAIEFQNIYKSYRGSKGDVAALYDINLQIEAGEAFGVIGPSGAGKTSLIRLVSLLERCQTDVLSSAQELKTIWITPSANLRLARFILSNFKDEPPTNLHPH